MARISIAVCTRTSMPCCSMTSAIGQAVHDRGEHAHVVGPRALNLAGAVLDAAPEVAAAYDDADLDAQREAFLHRLAHGAYDAEVQAGLLVARQGLAAYFYQHALVDRFFLVHVLPLR